jgi:hypothetical protein
MKILHDAGVHVQLRLWPYSIQISGPVDQLLGGAKESGCSAVLCNPLKLYHASGSRPRLKDALGFDIGPDFENCGVYSAPTQIAQVDALVKLQALCREVGLTLYSCNFPRERQWRSCCAVDGLPGFEGIAKWSYYTNGWRIQDHCTFEQYMKDNDCPWHDEFEQEWDAGKLSRSIPDLVFHPEDLSYSRLSD